MKPVRIIQTLNDLSVAPRRGAWIETLRRSRITKRVVSHPAGVRGLKLLTRALLGSRALVAPRRGAWIET